MSTEKGLRYPSAKLQLIDSPHFIIQRFAPLQFPFLSSFLSSTGKYSCICPVLFVLFFCWFLKCPWHFVSLVFIYRSLHFLISFVFDGESLPCGKENQVQIGQNEDNQWRWFSGNKTTGKWRKESVSFRFWKSVIIFVLINCSRAVKSVKSNNLHILIMISSGPFFLFHLM